MYADDENSYYYIKVNIKDFDGNVLNISDFKLIIDDQRIESNIQFTGKQDNNGIIYVSLLDHPSISKYINKILYDKDETDPKISCTLKYTLTHNKKKYDILYEGNMYLAKQ